MKRLFDLEGEEVSFVPRGAVKRKFLVLKSKDNGMTKAELLEKLKHEPDALKRVELVLKAFGKVAKETNSEGPLDEQTQAAIKAVVRILNPFKEKLSPLALHQALDAAGIQVQRAETEKGSDMAVKDEDHCEAMKSGMDAYKASLEKMGYRKYPDDQITQKAAKSKSEDTEDDEDDDDKAESKKAKAKKAKEKAEKSSKEKEEPKQEGSMAHSDEKESVRKSLLANVPDETRPALEAIFKGYDDMAMANKVLSETLTKVTRDTKRKEMVAKAAGFKHLGLGVEETADMLLNLSETSPKEYEQVVKSFEVANEAAGKGDLFKEIGSSLPSGGKTTWDKIEKAAAGWVEKSGEKLTEAAAVTRFLETPDGRKMYNEYMNEHPTNRRG